MKLFLTIVAVCFSLGMMSDEEAAIVRSQLQADIPGDTAMEFILRDKMMDQEYASFHFLEFFKSDDVPQEVVDAIKARLKAAYPHRYRIQKIVFEAEIKAYKMIHSNR
jgi:hypothetical protein